MGWTVISFCTIEGDFPKDKAEEIRDYLKREAHNTYDIHAEQETVTFEAQGNRAIDYDFMKKIHRLLKGFSYEITCSEYSETGNGYHFDSNNYRYSLYINGKWKDQTSLDEPDRDHAEYLFMEEFGWKEKIKQDDKVEVKLQ